MFEVEFNEDAAKKVRSDFKESYTEFVKVATDEYSRMAQAKAVPELLKNVLVNALPEVLKTCGITYDSKTVRATVHVDDIVFRPFLYQLVDYYPAVRSNGGAGRRFSQRYGIIGQSWRLDESVGRGSAISALGSSSGSVKREEAARVLVSQWGMTDEEAMDASHERPATLSVILRYEGQRYGLLYIDSTHKNAFGTDSVSDAIQNSSISTADCIAHTLESHSATVRLARAVSEVLNPLRLAAPFLEVGK